MNIMYKSSQDREINLNTRTLKFGSGAIFDYEWKPVADDRQYGTKIRQFNKEAKELEIVVYLSGSDADKKAAMNTLIEACEYDVVTQNSGRLYFNKYYINCFLTSVETAQTVPIGGDTAVELTFYCANPFWIREHDLLNFGKGGTISEDEFLDYPHGYDYDYSMQQSNVSITNTHYVGADFILSINGPVVNPTVYIGGHAYGVECELKNENEYLVINSIEKTIYLNENGTLVNMFDYRNRDSYIFEPISPGENYVSWDSGFSWSIILVEKRSEPKWT